MPLSRQLCGNGQVDNGLWPVLYKKGNLIHLLRSWVAGAHLACDFPRLLQATDDEYEPKEPFFGEDQPDDQ